MTAQFPVVLIGNGCIRSGASEKMMDLIEKCSLPVVSTFMGKGVIPENHFLHLGILGAFSGDVTFRAIQMADVVLAIGYDFTEIPAGYWNNDRTRLVIHVDSTPAEIDEHYPVRYEMIGDINRTLYFVLQQNEKELQTKTQYRLKEIAKLKKEFDEQFYPKERGNYLNPSDVVKIINETISEETIVSVDVGEHKIWMSRCLFSNKPRTYLVSNGLATMGFSIPAAIAAKIIFPQRPVLCTVGDGGFAMTFGELETIRRLKLAFPILVFDNDLLGLIYAKQKKNYGKRRIGVALCNPDFVLIAKAFGMNGVEVETESELKDVLEEALLGNKTTIIDVNVDPDETLRMAEALGQTRSIP